MNRKITRMYIRPIFFILSLLWVNNAWAQKEFPVAEYTNYAEVSQQLGLASIKVRYKKVCIAENQIQDSIKNLQNDEGIWNPSVDAPLEISFSDPVYVNGDLVQKGTYHVFLKSTSEQEYLLLLCTASDEVEYKASRLKYTLSTKPTTFFKTECLTVFIADLFQDSGSLFIAMANFSFEIEFEFDPYENILRRIREDYLYPKNTTTAEEWYTAARYCVKEKINQEEAIAWINQAIKMESAFKFFILKSVLQHQLGRKTASIDALNNAFLKFNPKDLEYIEYEYFEEFHIDQVIHILRKKVKSMQHSVDVYMHISKAYEQKKDYKKVIRFLKKARSKSKLNSEKIYIGNLIEKYKALRAEEKNKAKNNKK